MELKRQWLPGLYDIDIDARYKRCAAVLDSCQSIPQVDCAQRYAALMRNNIDNAVYTGPYSHRPSPALKLCTLLAWDVLHKCLLRDCLSKRKDIANMKIWKLKASIMTSPKGINP